MCIHFKVLSKKVTMFKVVNRVSYNHKILYNIFINNAIRLKINKWELRKDYISGNWKKALTSGLKKIGNSCWIILKELYVKCYETQIKQHVEPWLVWLSGLSARLRLKELPVWFPVRTHVWVAGQVPRRGRTRGSHTLMFLSLSFSLPSPL